MTPQHLAEYLEASAARDPHHLAVVDATGHGTTFADLNRQANALARFLAARGVTRGDRVGVVMPKGIPALVSLFGITKAGAAYVPVDFAAPAERGRKILADCQVRAIIVDGRSLEIIPRRETIQQGLAAVIVVGAVASSSGEDHPTTSYERALETDSPPLAIERHIDDLAYIIYTSGSTGTPKGVPISHRNALSFIEWSSSYLTPSPADRFSSHAPFHFDASVLDIYPAIKHGATIHLIPEELGRDPRGLAQFVASRQITVWTSTASALTMLVQFGKLEAHGPWSLRVVSFGGEVFPVKHLRELMKEWPSAAFYNLYGPTETTTACTFSRIPAAIPDERETPYPIGFPCTHCNAIVLDHDGHEVAAGKEGFLYISGPSVFRGYWNRPNETAAAFIYRAGVPWYNTGDLVRWDPDEGFTYCGRNDRMVKRRGYRIELDEIERALYSHSHVSEVAVVSISDPDAGARIVAFVSCRGAERPSIVDLKMFCAGKLPSYMNPDQFVYREQLPKTSTDKVDYQLLKGQLQGSRAA